MTLEYDIITDEKYDYSRDSSSHMCKMNSEEVGRDVNGKDKGESIDGDCKLSGLKKSKNEFKITFNKEGADHDCIIVDLDEDHNDDQNESITMEDNGNQAKRKRDVVFTETIEKMDQNINTNNRQ